MNPKVAAYLEIGAKRTFAGTVEWPGWCRAGRDETEALGRLVAYGPRYAEVVERAVGRGRKALGFDPPSDPSDLHVVERLTGNATTDFGAPGIALAADGRAIDDVDLARLTQILESCWAAFDRAAASAEGVHLRTGPRGGGRDLAGIAAHVVEAEEAYISVLGSRPPKHPAGGIAAVATQLRAAELATLAAIARQEAPANPSGGKKRWLPRYFVRRAAWHALDHAWEIEDRATP